MRFGNDYELHICLRCNYVHSKREMFYAKTQVDWSGRISTCWGCVERVLADALT